MKLIEAVNNDDVEKTVAFLESGVDVHQFEDDAKITALHFSVLNDNQEIADILISHGADCHRCNDDGESPYFMAQQRNDQKWLRKFNKHYLN